MHSLYILRAGVNERRKLTLVSAPAGYGKTTLVVAGSPRMTNQAALPAPCKRMLKSPGFRWMMLTTTRPIFWATVYLLDEVLKRQPEEIRGFLEKTALLRQFNAELCQAVTGNPASAAILAGLERSNLFLIPLDDQRGWYRFHHLFADVLRAGLDLETEREIRIRAAAWFESHAIFDEAIPYWLAIPDASRAAHLIGQMAPELLKNGELQILLGWLICLPETVVNQNPDLVSHKALCLLLTGQTLLARDYASQADQTFSGQTQNPGHGLLIAMQAWFAVNAGEQRTVELAPTALELEWIGGRGFLYFGGNVS